MTLSSFNPNSLSNTLSATGAATQEQLKHRKLADAAQSFEASFMGELLKGAHFGGDDNESGDDTMGSYGREALGKALSAAGGLGIARAVMSRVELQAKTAATGALPGLATTASLHG